MTITNYINLLLTSLIPPDTLRKGKLSVTQHEVAVLEYSKLRIHATVTSQSGYMDYNVIFSKKTEIEDFGITCNCPVKDKYCKHIAAAVLYLQQNKGLVNFVATKKEEEEVIVLQYEYLTSLNELLAPVHHSHSRAFLNASKFTDLEFIPNEFVRYKYAGRDETIEIKISALAHDHLIIRTNKEKLLDSDVFQSFRYYLDRRTSNKIEYFSALIPQHLQERVLYEKFGFESLEEAKLHLSFFYNRGVVTALLKNRQIQSVKNNHYLKLGKSFDAAANEFVIEIPDRYEKKSIEWSLAFVMDMSIIKNGSFQLPIVPILGQKDKNGIISKNLKLLSEIPHFEQPVFTALEEELIFLASLLKNHKPALKSQNEVKVAADELSKMIPHAAAFHTLMKKFIHLNNQQYPIFEGDLAYKLSKNKVSQLHLFMADKASTIQVSKQGNVIDIGFQYFVPPIDETAKERHHTKFLENMFFTNRLDHFYVPMHYGECMIGHVFDEIDERFQYAHSALHTVVKDFLSPLSKLIEIEYQFPIEETASSALSRKVYLSEVNDFLVLKLAVEYSFGEVNVLESSDSIVTQENKLRKYSRDRVYEDNFISLVTEQHPDLNNENDEDYFHLSFNELLRNAWYIDFFQVLKDNDIEVFGKEKLKRVSVNAYKPMTLLRTSSDMDWFNLKVKVSFNGHSVSLRDIRKAIVKKDEYILLKDGSMGLLPEDWVQKYAHVLSLGEVKSEEIRISKLQFSLLDDLLVDITEDEIRQEIKEKKKRFLHFDAMEEVPLPLGIQASLRDYQLAGYQWLHFLHKYKWGGCLADDMGLGKTIQIITFLSSVLLPEQPHLIVVPTTLLFNWEQELQKFAPHLTYHIWHSVREKDTSHFKNFDLILSTYGVISSDIEQLKEIAFNYIVLDESQAIKNPLSLRYKSAIQLKGINKLVMTGTPIENNIFDLYAQMNFVNPGLLGSVEMFRNQFVTKLERQDSVNDNRLLKGLIKPFILRRTKEQVLKELPSKTEITLYCEMEKEQRDVYETFRKRIQEDLLEKAQESGMSKIGIYIIDGLLKLRQICNSPAILNTEVDYGHESVKLNELMRNITEKTGKHKVLVFSQFVKMLQQVVPALEAANIPYCYLDGQTSNRSKVVNEFVHNEEKRVFLISLKSGGFGLNLTVADYVFLIDPWWNPAVENQAIDRVHRIGQDKKVFAYRMICKDTIEEKIMLIQQKKKQLSTEIISSESSFIKNLKKEDLMFLLS